MMMMKHTVGNRDVTHKTFAHHSVGRVLSHAVPWCCSSGHRVVHDKDKKLCKRHFEVKEAVTSESVLSHMH
jgi:hypothetical protein